VDLMRVLLANGADPNITTADHTTPLMAAAGVGIWAVGESPGTNEEALEAVKLTLELGADAKASAGASGGQDGAEPGSRRDEQGADAEASPRSVRSGLRGVRSVSAKRRS